MTVAALVSGDGITDLLDKDVPLDDKQYQAGHSSPRTSKPYDRWQIRQKALSMVSN